MADVTHRKPMRLTQRIVGAAVLIALTGVLGGCSSSMSGFDPTDLLDFLDTKKKLPGDRKPVFPSGVPGLEQGVPRNLYRGNAEQPQTDAALPPDPGAAPPPEPKSKRGTKSRAKGNAAVATAPAVGPDAAQQSAEPAPIDEGGTDAAPPAPKLKKKLVRKRTTSLPVDEPAAAPAPARPPPQQQAPSAFPAPLPGGSFSR